MSDLFEECPSCHLMIVRGGVTSPELTLVIGLVIIPMFKFFTKEMMGMNQLIFVI